MSLGISGVRLKPVPITRKRCNSGAAIGWLWRRDFSLACHRARDLNVVSSTPGIDPQTILRISRRRLAVRWRKLVLPWRLRAFSIAPDARKFSEDSKVAHRYPADRTRLLIALQAEFVIVNGQTSEAVKNSPEHRSLAVAALLTLAGAQAPSELSRDREGAGAIFSQLLQSVVRIAALLNREAEACPTYNQNKAGWSWPVAWVTTRS
jgi:hypothetical protein